MTKMIKDPIHGPIEFGGEAEIQLKSMLADPYFQRLRRVKQLGFSDYVFPSAAHSRFAHSLGVYSVAKRMLSVVEPPTTRKKGDWTPKGQACLAAALLHDIGHGMFSHAFENAMKLFLERNSQADYSALQAAVSHEKVSQRIITESSIASTLAELGGPNFPSIVAGMVNKQDEKCVYTSIVSSQLDADRLDYAKRDPYFAGVSSGGIDVDWLIRNFQLGSAGNSQFLYVDSKAYISLEKFTVTLFQLYPTLYLHKRTRGLEYMFSLLMSRVFERIAESDEKAAGLTSNHPLVRFFREPERLENALLLDDTLFWGSLHLFQDATVKSIRTVADRITSRKFYPMLDVWKIAEEVAAEEGAMKAFNAAARVDVLHKVCEDVSNCLREKSGLWTEACYYDRYPRPIYKPLDIEGGDPQQINVKVGGKIVDIASISPIVASAASFNIHRIFFDDLDEGLHERLAEEIRSGVRRGLAEEVKGGCRV
jgi:HD superfamily phosphohydrolase